MSRDFCARWRKICPQIQCKAVRRALCGVALIIAFSSRSVNRHIRPKHGNSIYFFGTIHNSCKPSVKHRYSCFTTSSGGRCPPHSPPAREITSPLTPECRLRRFFIIYLKVNAVAVIIIALIVFSYKSKSSRKREPSLLRVVI